ncbi:hypothetical protein ZWY2020_057877 [Hordeum vulgare]|nr:hypothetical protein ZWY2020_057877 [Hordeum vulgare]
MVLPQEPTVVHETLSRKLHTSCSSVSRAFLTRAAPGLEGDEHELENAPLSEILPLQKDSTLASRVLKFIQSMSLKDPLHPVGIIQECLSKCIKKQVDHIGKQILCKLMGEWRLMDELLVSWPLDLIANLRLKKYNKVMGFFLKVKRAKFVLDETRKWMWKARQDDA